MRVVTEQGLDNLLGFIYKQVNLIHRILKVIYYDLVYKMMYNVQDPNSRDKGNF